MKRRRLTPAPTPVTSVLVEEFLGRYDEHPAEADWYAGFERDPHDECVALPPVAPVELARAA